MSTAADIEKLLHQAFSPHFLHVEDESWKHAGHVGAQSGAGHYIVEIASPTFEGKSRIASHRMINNVLAPLFPEKIHALSIKIRK